MTTPTWRAVEQLMGLPVSVALRGRHAGDPTARAAWDAVVAELSEVDRLFSTYRPDSVVSRLDRGELTLAEAPAQVHEVLALGERARVESRGAFDVRRRDASGVLRLDPSGVVKGWAVQRATAHLARLPDTDYCLGAGGDLVARVRTGGSPWQVGIEDPRDPARLVGRVPLRDGAIATSSEARRGAHIVDARTGERPGGLLSVTVLGPTLTEADIDATAAFALGAEGEGWLRARRDGVVVRSDGSVRIVGPRSAATTTTASADLNPAHVPAG